MGDVTRVLYNPSAWSCRYLGLVYMGMFFQDSFSFFQHKLCCIHTPTNLFFCLVSYAATINLLWKNCNGFKMSYIRFVWTHPHFELAVLFQGVLTLLSHIALHHIWIGLSAYLCALHCSGIILAWHPRSVNPETHASVSVCDSSSSLALRPQDHYNHPTRPNASAWSCQELLDFSAVWWEKHVQSHLSNCHQNTKI